ncbi:MAG: hypothetical protein ABUL73_04050 [Alphaproteobacteria bacterium]
MKPSFAQVLMGVASTLADDIAPHVGEEAPFAVGHLGTIGLILACAAQEADRAVETAILEQDALKALFAEAALSPLDLELRARLRAAAENDARPSLKLSDLEGQTTKLKFLLMELLEAVEAERFDWAEQLESRIWNVLKSAAERRALYLPVL